MKYIFKILYLISLLLFFAITWMFSQTCCSGGVPLSGNIGFDGAESGVLQMELSYDLNYLATLKDGSELYADESRHRITQSILLKTGYSITDRLALDALVTYVNQSRRISYFGEVNQVQTNGIGDAVVMVKYLLSRISQNRTEIQLGAGPKFPLGQSDLSDERGITLNADLQPGSGSWDLITWGHYMSQLKLRPSVTVSGSIVGRVNGSNREYLGSQMYRFGNSFQVYLGLGDQVSFRNKMFSTSLSVRYRMAFPDRINEQDLDNTGGQWINILPAFGLYINQNTIIHIIPEIPVYSRVEGIQLTPTFRLQASIYHTFGKINKHTLKDYQL